MTWKASEFRHESHCFAEQREWRPRVRINLQSLSLRITTMLFESKRRFQVWAFSVSHGGLVIRSPMFGGLVDNVDLTFQAVMYMQFRNSMDGLTVEEAEEDEYTALGLKNQDARNCGAVLYRLTSEGRRGYVFGALFSVDVHKRDPMAPLLAASV